MISDLFPLPNSVMVLVGHIQQNVGQPGVTCLTNHWAPSTNELYRMMWSALLSRPVVQVSVPQRGSSQPARRRRVSTGLLRKRDE